MQDFQIIDIIENVRSRLQDQLDDLEKELDRTVVADYRTAASWNLMEVLARLITGLDGNRPSDNRKIQAWINRAHAIAGAGPAQAVNGKSGPNSWVIHESDHAPDSDLPQPDEHQARAIRYLSLSAFYLNEDASTGGDNGASPNGNSTAPADAISVATRQRTPSRFGQELSTCAAVEDALALARKRLPRLKPLLACQFLTAIDYPIAPPWPDLVRFCEQLGLLPVEQRTQTPDTKIPKTISASATAKTPDAIHKISALTAAIQRASRLTCIPFAHVLHMLALYCGARPLPGSEKPICHRKQPACDQCRLTSYCSRYPLEIARLSQNGAADHETRKTSIKSWAADERPRERMLAGERLATSELLAIILRTGSGKLSAVELARKVINEFGNLHELQKATPGVIMERMRGSGIGPAKAVEICAAIELGRRATQPAADTRSGLRSITCSRDVFEAYRSRYKAAVQEEFLLLLLDTKQRILKDITVSVGTINASLAHPRDVFRLALREGAFAVIFLHNHPSGDPTPSEQDILLTARLVDAGRLLGVEVTDHIIIGSHQWYSFRDHGRIR